MKKRTEPVDTNFQKGDEVQFQVVYSKKLNGYIPRWNENGDDLGKSDIIAVGLVKEIIANYIVVEFTVERATGIGVSKWPYVGHPKYTSWQWVRDGFLRKINKKKCECGSESTYGLGTLLHSDWCPLSKRSKNV